MMLWILINQRMGMELIRLTSIEAPWQALFLSFPFVFLNESPLVSFNLSQPYCPHSSPPCPKRNLAWKELSCRFQGRGPISSGFILEKDCLYPFCFGGFDPMTFAFCSDCMVYLISPFDVAGLIYFLIAFLALLLLLTILRTQRKLPSFQFSLFLIILLAFSAFLQAKAQMNLFQISILQIQFIRMTFLWNDGGYGVKEFFVVVQYFFLLQQFPPPTFLVSRTQQPSSLAFFLEKFLVIQLQETWMPLVFVFIQFPLQPPLPLNSLNFFFLQSTFSFSHSL